MSDSDPDALQERVDELETAVAQQQETIRDMLPSRRGVLAGMAGVAAGAAGMNAATEEAAAQSAVGQVGTESNPVDVEGATGKFDSVNTEIARITDDSNITVNVPTDYDSVQNAVDDLAKRVKPDTTRVVVTIESGHAFKGLLVKNGHFGHFQVTSEDAVVDCDATYINNNKSGVVWNVQRAFGPQMDTKFDALNQVNNRGFDITEGSWSPRQTVGSGVINMDGIGLRMGSSCSASCRGMDFSGASGPGLEINSGTIYAKDIDVSNCREGIYLQNSCVVVAPGADCSGAENQGVALPNGGFCDVHGATITNCGGVGIDVKAGVVKAENADVSSSDSRGVSSTNGGVVDAQGITATGCTDHGVFAQTGGKINAKNADVSNNTTTDARVSEGAQITLFGATTTGGTPDVGDTSVTSFNAIDGSDGIIWA